MKKIKAFGLLILIYAFLLIFVNGFGIGNIFILLMGIVFANYAKIYKYKFLHYAVITCVTIFIIGFIFLFAFGHNNNVNYDEDVIIVLGAGLKKDRVSVSETLKNRLDACIKYVEKNEEAIIIVSGGQGIDEDISEALAMKNYLVSKGVKENKILLEDKSTSTYENFKFSKEILDDKFKEKEYTVTFVTNDYHIFRAYNIAKDAGFTSRHIYAKTPTFVILSSYIREEIANIAYLFNIKG